MGKNLLISVIMPVYNSEETIERAIDSIINQTLEDYELIIIAERMTNDATMRILNEYERRDKRIILIKKPSHARKGIAISLNIGLSYARGKYIARMDSDDYSYPQRFQLQYEYMEANPDIIVCGSQVMVVRDGKSVKSMYPSRFDIIKPYSLFYTPLIHPTAIIRKQFLDVYNIKYVEEYPNYYPEDQGLWRSIIDCGGIISNIDDVLLDYSFGSEFHLSKEINTEKSRILCNFIRERIEKLFHIDTSGYEDSIFLMHGLVFDGLRNTDKYEVVRAYSLLATIEEKNDSLAIYNNDILGTILLRRWNEYVSDFYLNTSYHDSAISLSLRDKDYYVSFRNSLSKYLNVPMEFVADRISDIITGLKLTARKYQSVIIFGIGKATCSFLDNHPGIKGIIAYCDNNTKDNDNFKGKPLIKPSQLKNYNYDGILIGTSKYYYDIRKQLIEVNKVSEEKISYIDCLLFRE